VPTEPAGTNHPNQLHQQVYTGQVKKQVAEIIEKLISKLFK
jgi:hypothetical protein